MKKNKIVAIVLAGGQGRRMNSTLQKQFLLIDDKPVLYYSLAEFQKSEIDEIVLVVSPGTISYCERDIVKKYGFSKVTHIVEGGEERYHSVINGIKTIKECEYLLIHDGARPFVDQDIIKRTLYQVKKHKACIVGMPVKDTIKVVDEDQFVGETPKRDRLWIIQTPQAFQFDLIKGAYEEFIGNQEAFATDDAMVVEAAAGTKVKLVEGSYRNIKITTPEDLLIANAFLKKPS